MPTDQGFLFLLTILFGFLWAALQMTGSKLLGLIMMILCLESLWLVFQPTPAIFWWGFAAILILCGFYGWWIYEPPKSILTSAPSPQISSTHQSGGITGNRNIVINPVPNTKPKIRLEQQTKLVFFYREGKQIRETYRVPNDVDRAPAKKWVKKVADYLEKNIGPITANLFLSDEGIPFADLLDTKVSRMNKKTYRHLSNRLLRLEEIMKKVEG